MPKVIIGNKTPCIANLDDLLERVRARPVSIGSSFRMEALQTILENREACNSNTNWKEANERVTI